MREDNELYSDPHIGFGPYMRTYTVGFVMTKRSSGYKQAKNKPLSKMKRFAFKQEIIGPESDEGLLYVLDTHSKRIYCGTSSDSGNVFWCEWVVDLTQHDIDSLVSKLTEYDVQNWKKNSKKDRDGYEYSIGIEYDDGSVEPHHIEGSDESIKALLIYFKSEQARFKDRMLNDRKTTVNIDYLVSYLGWDPSRASAEKFNVLKPVPLLEIPPIEIESIERIVIFEAEGPHEVRDHSRSPQKTLFLDISAGKVYYEPETAIYEKIYNASVIRNIEESEAENIISLLYENTTEWNANRLYITDEEAMLTLWATDIPAWSIGIQYSDGTIVHFSGDGIGEGGWAPGCREVLDALFAAITI